jgi:site-specific DNA-cytosine methylase
MDITRIISSSGRRAAALLKIAGKDVIIFEDFTWEFADDYNVPGMGPSLPKKYERLKSTEPEASALELRRAIEAKRYKDLTPEELRIYNRFKKQESLNKQMATPEGRARLLKRKYDTLMKFYDRLRQAGKLSEHYKAISQATRRRRLRLKAQASTPHIT